MANKIKEDRKEYIRQKVQDLFANHVDGLVAECAETLDISHKEFEWAIQNLDWKVVILGGK